MIHFFEEGGSGETWLVRSVTIENGKEKSTMAIVPVGIDQIKGYTELGDKSESNICVYSNDKAWILCGQTGGILHTFDVRGFLVLVNEHYLLEVIHRDGFNEFWFRSMDGTVVKQTVHGKDQWKYSQIFIRNGVIAICSSNDIQIGVINPFTLDIAVVAIKEFETPQVFEVVFSPNGNLVAYFSSSPHVHIVDIPMLQTFGIRDKYPQRYTCIRFSDCSAFLTFQDHNKPIEKHRMFQDKSILSLLSDTSSSDLEYDGYTVISILGHRLRFALQRNQILEIKGLP